MTFVSIDTSRILPALNLIESQTLRPMKSLLRIKATKHQHGGSLQILPACSHMPFHQYQALMSAKGVIPEIA